MTDDYEVGYDYSQLKLAGTFYLPSAASEYAAGTSAVNDLHDRLSYLSAATGGRAVLMEAEVARETLHEAMRRTTLALIDSGHALVTIAETFLATDGHARDTYADLVAQTQQTGTLPVPVSHVQRPTPGLSDTSDGGWTPPPLDTDEVPA